MKHFRYQAKDLSTGQIQKGSVQAENQKGAATVLVAQGFTPLKIEEVTENETILARLKGRISTKDRVVFTRQLATLIGAGIPLAQSLHTVREQTQNMHMKRIVDDVISSIEGGRSLSETFSAYPEVYNATYIALVKAGEASGTLDDALHRLAVQQEKDAEMLRKVRSAMTYPIIVLVVIFLVIGFMLVKVIPQIQSLYNDLGQELPFISQLLVNTANFVIDFWWVVILALAAAIFSIKQYFTTEAGIRVKDSLKINFPLFGSLFQKLYMARFMRTGQTLLKTGVPMLDMLQITSEAVNNVLPGDAIGRAAEKVKGGKELSKSLEAEQYILPFVPQMIGIGEQSGKVDEMMGKAAQVYEEELDEQIKNISTLIEPLLMIILAVFAGGMVAAILLPIYSLVNTINLG